jgi:hypothetical protein
LAVGLDPRSGTQCALLEGECTSEDGVVSIITGDGKIMLNTIVLNADGSISAQEDGAKETRPLRGLACRIDLAGGFVLRSFFRMLDAYPVLVELNPFLPELMRRHQDCPAEGCNGGFFDFLEFGKTVEMIGFPGEPRLEIYPVFQGRSGDDISEIKSFNLDMLLDVPVALGKLQHVIFGDKTDRFEFETVYTLFEFIDGIAWALSFHNAPEQCGIGG